MDARAGRETTWCRKSVRFLWNCSKRSDICSWGNRWVYSYQSRWLMPSSLSCAKQKQYQVRASLTSRCGKTLFHIRRARGSERIIWYPLIQAFSVHMFYFQGLDRPSPCPALPVRELFEGSLWFMRRKESFWPYPARHHHHLAWASRRPSPWHPVVLGCKQI